MAAKNIFDVLKEMNENDTKDNTQHLKISNHFVRGDKVKQGAHITMGVEEGVLFDMASEKSICLLLVVDKEQYFKIKGD